MPGVSLSLFSLSRSVGWGVGKGFHGVGGRRGGCPWVRKSIARSKTNKGSVRDHFSNANFRARGSLTIYYHKKWKGINRIIDVRANEYYIPRELHINYYYANRYGKGQYLNEEYFSYFRLCTVTN